MWIVRLALRRPYTFVVMALAILLLGVLGDRDDADRHLPGDRHPGRLGRSGTMTALTTEDMASRITTFSEYAISSAVSDVRSIEIADATRRRRHQDLLPAERERRGGDGAGHGGLARRSCGACRRGTQPPFILRYNASSVPIPCSWRSVGRSIPEAQLYDYGIYRMRQQVAPIQGITLPLPYGGKPRQIMVDLDPQLLLRQRRSRPRTSATPSTSQNLTLPSGSAKIGPQEYQVSLNSSPDAVVGAQRAAGQGRQRRAPSTCATSRTCATASRSQTNIVRAGRPRDRCCSP